MLPIRPTRTEDVRRLLAQALGWLDRWTLVALNPAPTLRQR